MFTSCVNSQFIKQMQSISYFAFSNVEIFQKHSTTCTSHLNIHQVVGLSSLHISLSPTKQTNTKPPPTHVSSLLWMPAQVLCFNILGNYLTFRSKTQWLGKFLHKIGQTCVPHSISCAKHKNTVKGKQVHIQELPCHFKNDQQPHNSYHNFVANITTVEQGEEVHAQIKHDTQN